MFFDYFRPHFECLLKIWLGMFIVFGIVSENLTENFIFGTSYTSLDFTFIELSQKFKEFHAVFGKEVPGLI